MNRKIGKLKMWQWLAIGSVAGFALYEFSKGKSKVATEPETGLVASNNNPLAGGGGGESAGGGGLGSVAPGAPGEPGTPGSQGAPGESAPIQSLAPIENNLAQLESQISALNHPNTGTTNKQLPHATPSKFPQVNAKGEHYKTEKKHGKTIHVYHSGKKVVVGGAKPARKTNNAKHQAQKHSRQRAHPANPLHHASHAAPVAVHQHGRPVPIKHRTKKARR